MKNKNIIAVAVFLLSAILTGLFVFPDSSAYFIACNVGQGDAILLTKSTTQILIDGGPDDKVLDCLKQNMPFWDRKIELIVNTHPEKDHLAGLLTIVGQYQVEQIIANSFWQDSRLFADFVDAVRANDIRVYSPQAGDKLEINGLNIAVFWPEKALGDNSIWDKNKSLAESEESAKVLGIQSASPNTQSIVLLLEAGDTSALFTGDIDTKTEEKIISENNLGQIDILKVAHHGSKYSTGERFLTAIRPKIAVISVGKNPWGHPTEEVLGRLRAVGADILRTDQDHIKIKL